MTKVLGKIVVCMLVLALAASVAMAQGEGKKKRKPHGQRANASGVVTSVNENSITVKTKNGEETFAVSDKTKFSKMSPSSVDALGESQFVQISGQISEDGSSVEARGITVVPAGRGKGGVRGKRIMGTLTVSDGNMSVQAGEQTLAVTPAEKCRVMMTEEAMLTDVAEGARVSIMGRGGEGEKMANMVRIMPARAGKGGKGKKKHAEQGEGDDQ